MNILITGAARGIGAAIAQLAAKKGHTLGIYDINQTGANELAQQLNTKYAKKGGSCTSGMLDVTASDSWDAAIAHFIAFAGSIDILINNAGILSSGKFENTTLEKHIAQLNVNNKGLLMGCHKVKPHLAPHSNSKVINLSSGSSLYGQPDLATYSATKFFVRGLTEALDVEWSAQGIRCLDIVPLFVATDMVTNMQAGSIEKMGVNTSTKDVAKTALRLIQTPNHKFKQSHHAVGLKMTVFRRATQLLPDTINWKIHKAMVK